MASKDPKSIIEQIELLKQRGMLFYNEETAPHFLENISYYRLKGYWWEMQFDKINHIFNADSYFENVIDLYNFDRHLRLIMFDAIERIEVALRTKLIYHLSLSFGPLWYLKFDIFTDGINQMSIAGHLSNEISRSKEQFIVEHKNNHKNELLEAWKCLEVASMGSLSKIYKNLNHQLPEKSTIALQFGFNSHSDFSSFLEATTVIRNVIAHHSRLWNNNITIKYLWPKNLKNAPITYVPDENQRAKLFPLFSLILYTLEKVSPNNSIKNKFLNLLDEYPNTPIHKMGFPLNWKTQPIWTI
ncbi:Abi family protein [Flavobacterium sp. UBA6135]|uniref:Abi family protein n=1 Tax=Flavobacterium sp. UBA6135 TaxID=1946553 RepID=UPI0025C6103C|nr:Abi family protein [Flavobacterium sp. UBA6135]